MRRVLHLRFQAVEGESEKMFFLIAKKI